MIAFPVAAFYDVGGEIIDGTNILTSQKGDYFTGTRESPLHEDVLLRTAKRDSCAQILSTTIHGQSGRMQQGRPIC